MNLNNIVAMGYDRAGGVLVRQKIDIHALVGVAMGLVATMVLEMAAAGKSAVLAKEDVTFAANTREGSIIPTTIALPGYIRYRASETEAWSLIDIKETMPDLTRAEEAGEEAILFTSSNSGEWFYFLSFEPQTAIDAEIWSVEPIAALESLDAEITQIPPEAEYLVAYRTADFALNQLLLLDAAQYSPFVGAQKASLSFEISRCEHVWKLYLARAADWQSLRRIDEYDAMREFLESGDPVVEISAVN